MNTVLAGIGVLLVVVVFFAFRNRKTANQMLENNVGVVPLMQQKSTQMKVTRLQEATKDDTAENEKLQKLVAAYKNNQITIQQYNEKLDAMIYRLDIDIN
ncbi:hypothetical protein HQ865_01510 [Mucilaginibacter mali]|uniref:Uncharacterized protein n=1 Tax=Mucilaginibacter mali TaxID=2740462 RepID=A0A7D4QHM0_9SPHI|nr:hypothetical protein [Mucilaginibacter mali]QKJ28490.1 hypothetical protein HQ865_01510 [Mucilaginibacter mali]